MTLIARTYAAAATPLGALIDDLTGPDWAAPSPCDGWSAADVVGHLITTQADLLALVDVPAPAHPPLTDDPAGAWRAHAAGMLALLEESSAAGATYDGMFGPTTLGETLDTYYVFDMVAHRWDIARAAGRACAFTDAELDRLEGGIRTFGEHLYLDGICRPALTPGPDADRQERVLAALGRDA